MAFPPEHISELVNRANAGDEGSRDALLKWLQPILKGFFVRRIGMKVEVDDMVQNSLVRVHNGLGQIREPGSLKAFAMKAALFELHDYYRGRYRSKEVVLEHEVQVQDLLTRVQSVHIDLERAMSTLPAHTRRIVELREYGFRYSEIAEIVGSTEAAIKMQVKRAFEKLRDILAVLVGIVSLLLEGVPDGYRAAKM